MYSKLNIDEHLLDEYIVLDNKDKYYNREINIRELMELTGCTYRRVLYLLEKHNIKPRDVKDFDWKRLAKEHIETGRTLTDIAKETNLSVTTVHRYVKKYNHADKRKEFLEGSYEDIIDLFLEKHNYSNFDECVYDYFIAKKLLTPSLSNDINKVMEIPYEWLKSRVDSSKYPYKIHKKLIAIDILSKENYEYIDNGNLDLNNINYYCLDKNHGVHRTTYHSLRYTFAGCLKCKRIQSLEDKRETINQFFKDNGYKLAYGKKDFGFQPIKFKCLEHGIKETNYSNIKRGLICPQCKEYYSYIEDYDKIFKYSNQLKNKPCYIYILELEDGGKTFYKISISNSMNINSYAIPYKHKVVYSKRGSLYNMAFLFNNLIKYHLKYKIDVIKGFGEHGYYFEKMLLNV